MPRKRPPRSATVLLLLIALHLTGPYDVAARFRGAGHKPIPTVGDDGAVRSTGAGMKVRTTLTLRCYMC